MKWRRRLQRELRMEGASKVEASELTNLAQRIRTVTRGAQPAARRSLVLPRWALPAVYVCAGLIAGVLLVGLSQAALPDSALYPVQRASDNTAMLIDPSYRASVMMKRAAQVHELVQIHADQRQIMAVLANYTHVARSYMASPHTNYAALEYCETNLKAAAAESTPPVRQAITNSLESLESA